MHDEAFKKGDAAFLEPETVVDDVWCNYIQIVTSFVHETVKLNSRSI